MKNLQILRFLDQQKQGRPVIEQRLDELLAYEAEIIPRLEWRPSLH